MPADTKTINLLDQNDPVHSPFGRIIEWITSYGRYIMILTELVVLIAFASRFSLDRKLTDLNEEIAQKEDIIAANKTLESDIKSVQNQLKTIKNLLGNQSVIPHAMKSFNQSLPPDVYLDSLQIKTGVLRANVIARAPNGLSQLITNLLYEKTLKNVEIGSVAKQKNGDIEFALTAHIPTDQKQEK